MGVCIRVKKTYLKWYQKLWNILIGHKNRNYTYIEVKGDDE